MISLRDVSKAYRTVNGRKVILDGVSHDFAPGVNVGILGRNGQGKSTLIRMISGAESPDSGEIRKTARVSWPLGFRVGFNSKLSGRENIRFVCRLYGEDYRGLVRFVEDFAELGDYMDMPIMTYSSGMIARLTFGLSMAFRFDYYLIDELTAVGDSVFRKKSEECFAERRKQATLLVVSHSMGTIRRFCDKAMVLHQGKLTDFPDIDQAEAFYQKECCGMGADKSKAQGAVA
jgi:capsular polysaccharide transport system ATP-binding protein